MTEQCSVCTYGQATATVNGVVSRFCRRRAPGNAEQVHGRERFLWPIVEDTAWCGEGASLAGVAFGPPALPTTYYVATTGNDVTGDGTAAKPWATPQRAMDYIAALATAGDLVVQMADGTYNFGDAFALQIKARIGGGTLTFRGNTGDKTKVVWNSGAYPNVQTIDSEIGGVTIAFLQLRQDESNAWLSVNNYATGGSLSLDSVDSGGGSGLLYSIGYSNLSGDIGILSAGTAAAYLWAEQGGMIFVNLATLTAGVPVAFSDGFAQATLGGRISWYNASLTGTITGAQAVCYEGGQVYCYSTSLAMLPGNAAPIVCDELSGVFWRPTTNLTNRSFAGTSRNRIRVPITDTGTTVTFGANNGAHQTYTLSGDRTFAFSGWPLAGFRGEVEIELTNGGAHTITWPTVNWIKPDGATSTTFSDTGITLAAAGVNFIELWSRDAGTTVYGRVVVT